MNIIDVFSEVRELCVFLLDMLPHSTTAYILWIYRSLHLGPEAIISRRLQTAA